MTTPQPSSGQRQGRLTLRELQTGRHTAEQSYHECLAVRGRWVGLGEINVAASLRAKQAMMPELEGNAEATATALRRLMPDDRLKVRILYGRSLSILDVATSPRGGHVYRRFTA